MPNEKSKSKDVPWPKHKHEYQEVLLEYVYRYQTTSKRCVLSRFPAKVCKVCGRIDSCVDTPKYYKVERVFTKLPHLISDRQLTEEAYKLPVWHTDNFMDKQAKEGHVHLTEEDLECLINKKDIR